MEFEYELRKSEANFRKHGIHLEEAKGLWGVLSVEIEAKNIDEPRFMIIGALGEKLYSCIFTHGDETIRLISARRSSKKEDAIYYGATEKN